MNDPARVLVVDDTPSNVKLLADILAARGYTALTAATGAQALSVIERDAPDLVLLDVMMPGMSGYDVCRTIRQNPATAMLPVVMVTALDPGEERVKGLDAGADDFLTKPIHQAELLARVRSLLRVKSLWDQLAELSRTLEQRGSSGSSRRSSPRRSSAGAPTTRSRATGARSPWSSSTCGDSPPSPRRRSPRRSWGCCANTTPRWAG